MENGYCKTQTSLAASTLKIQITKVYANNQTKI